MNKPLLFSVSGFATLLAIAGFAHAEPPRETKALDPAEKLFEEARVAMAAKDYPTACARFEASHRLSPGAGVLASLGDCEEHRGHLLAARDAFNAAAELFTKPEKKRYALERAAAVERTIPKLTVHLSEPSPADVEIVLDDKPIAPKATTLLDPGHYTVVVRAPKHKPRTYPIDLRSGEARLITAEPLDSFEVPGPPQPVPPKTVSAERTKSPLRPIGFVVAGVGVVGLGVGAITGAMALGNASTVRSSCNTGVSPAVCKNQEGLDAMSSGSTNATLSTIGFIGGGALLTAGIVMVLVSPKASSSTAIAPMMGPGTAGLTMWRSF